MSDLQILSAYSPTSFPNIFLYTLPMASMLGITICFSRLSTDMELLALKAGGISIYKILPPVFLVASAITLIAFYFSTQLIPASELAMKKLSYQILKEKIDQGIQAHKFTDAMGDIVIYVDKVDKETGDWHNVWVSDMRGVKQPTITMARSGSMKSNSKQMSITIKLTDGSLHRPEEQGTEIITFKDYTINMPLETGGKNIFMLHKRLLSMPELLEQAKRWGNESKKRGRIYLIEFHKRLILPIGCLMLSFLALPLGLQARPGKKAIGIPVGLGIFIVYYILHTVGKELAEAGTVPLIPALWLPNVLFFLLAIFWIYRATNEKGLFPTRCSLFLTRLFSRLKRKITRLKKNT
ncbi:LptF/LptG family permease [Desulfotalea psychrophila]|uniref:Lipopolysaccharide export system permease protein LptF n=1 Tax=Desulfotalea psychrophila (strain LSv54 / DSM 12343) TaxID=177439 RepID=Q6AK14_DESPS|nr:LptF/LptG family permease [Desulfotalea psychrophila]CAG37312.1 hypothetical protein DP2583 [Desulfotalea psychrophila LSv54]